MPIKNVKVGTTPMKIFDGSAKRVRLSVQNLGSADVYLLSNPLQTTSQGIEIESDGVYSNDRIKEPRWLISETANQDCRIEES